MGNDPAKAILGEVCRKHFGEISTNQTSSKSYRSIPCIEIKSFVELDDGSLIDEEDLDAAKTLIELTGAVVALARLHLQR